MNCFSFAKIRCWKKWHPAKHDATARKTHDKRWSSSSLPFARICAVLFFALISVAFKLESIPSSDLSSTRVTSIFSTDAACGFPGMILFVLGGPCTVQSSVVFAWLVRSRGVLGPWRIFSCGLIRLHDPWLQRRSFQARPELFKPEFPRRVLVGSSVRHVPDLKNTYSFHWYLLSRNYLWLNNLRWLNFSRFMEAIQSLAFLPAAPNSLRFPRLKIRR